ncbi:E3 ubiquitin-protein ligase rififylin isoform X3 [Strigops habroptila]|uniref:RING-type E3 ubiquitin transferase n=2 Tax=Strigops habroptila TaxID=2489341 RepID=A0A672TXS2_STRHB|nr:E3 ubiquitin-protein ligase rififylin isoform X3 [Strigops habroptila]XP_030328266.1 E3 ubiquitin-protein ligase rififylin isoform X3 [Strigops habroptila]XP_030328267.1 E3 ubiquitin-protein ligase rififylin isoform X3 [Strigops habroptila]XP_030328268.1 E3 ubiquitin-protein ligase rififylin isoform X3 [Strigops habroptila]XP_030328269.1 E3 ubiquitin-protein ligase rififylin isoform X3 [Strigops habroptila]XP_030328270.1 E3 ubiquitin-protein ligase rififylin isoform X3 [Strigops habroptila]
MWASCCNWFCLDGSPEEMQPQPEQGARAQAYSNPGYSSYPSPTASEQSCKACGMRFDSSSRKHVCLDCKKNFCTSCSSQAEGGPLLCHLCQRFRATAFQREELIKMKVKDLRDYLALHEISTELCREKEDLVLLILGQQPVITQEDQIRTNPFHTSASGQQDFVILPPTGPASSTSHDASPGSADPISSSLAQEHEQANGYVPPSQVGMTGVEIAAEAPTEEETQSTDSEDNLVQGRKASLSDLTSIGDINALSVRQLKEILARNFVNYKGCCEKWELLERVTRLYKEKDLQHLVSDTDDQTGGAGLPGTEENLCKICMDAPIDCVLLECGHMVTCTKCGKRMSECPICRQYVIRAIHVFKS